VKDVHWVLAIQALALGFALSGLVAAAFEYFTARRASFRLLQTGERSAYLAVPLVVIAAPYIIVRNSLNGRRLQGRPWPFVIAGASIAIFWGLLVGWLVLDAAMAVASGLAAA
jgi:hypothetical protein